MYDDTVDQDEEPMHSPGQHPGSGQPQGDMVGCVDPILQGQHRTCRPVPASKFSKHLAKACAFRGNDDETRSLRLGRIGMAVDPDYASLIVHIEQNAVLFDIRTPLPTGHNGNPLPAVCQLRRKITTQCTCSDDQDFFGVMERTRHLWLLVHHSYQGHLPRFVKVGRSARAAIDCLPSPEPRPDDGICFDSCLSVGEPKFVLGRRSVICSRLAVAP